MSLLQNFIDINNLSIVSITETWLVGGMSSSYVDLPGFKFFRGDVRGSVRKHGAGLYVKSNYTSVPVDVHIPNVVVVFVREFDTYIISCYRPPSNTENDDSAFMTFLNEFSSGRTVILMGDFNLPTLRWNDEELLVGGETPRDREFFDAFLIMGLEQWVREPTFIPSGNILDLVFTSDDDVVSGVEVLAPLPGCHHCPVVVTVHPHRSSSGSSSAIVHRMWHRANYNRICDYLQTVDWEGEFEDLSAAECYQVFVDTMSEIVELFVPVVEVSPGRPAWITKPPRSLISERSRAWAHYKYLRGVLGRNHEEAQRAYVQFRDINIRYKNFARNNQCDHERKLASALSESSKPFHAYIRRRKEGRPSVGPLRVNGEVISDNRGMTEVLAECFGEVFRSGHQVSNTANQTTDCVMTPLEIGYDAVLGLFRDLDPSSACGPDDIHPRLLKSCAALLAYPLTTIMQKSLLTGSFPLQWKESIVVPLFKKGPRSTPSNYRPVSMTSSPCKGMERILASHIVAYLEDNALLSPNQFGFRAGRSTEDQLLLFYDVVAREVDTGGSIDAAFLDLFQGI